MDEETFGSNDALRMMFEFASDSGTSAAKKMINIKIGLRKLISRPIHKSVIERVSIWLKNGRFGSD